MTDKQRLRKAYEHGKKCGTWLMSNLPERYTPLTFDSWYEQFRDAYPCRSVDLKDGD